MLGCAEQVYNIYVYICVRVRVHLIHRHGTVVVELVLLRPLPLRRAHLVSLALCVSILISQKIPYTIAFNCISKTAIIHIRPINDNFMA